MVTKSLSDDVLLDEKDWREETLRNAYQGIMNEDAMKDEIGRLHGLQELMQKKSEEERRRKAWIAFLNHPVWIAVPSIFLCIYSHFTFGLVSLPGVVFRQIILLQPPSTLADVVVAAGILVTSYLAGKCIRRSLQATVPELALLFDLCCLGLAVACIPRLFLWMRLQILHVWSRAVSV